MSRHDNVKVRRLCFDKWKRIDANGRVWLDCHICGLPIDVTKGEPWEAEHVIPNALGGQDVRPAHPQPCHREKTKQDAADISRARRIHEKHYGIRRSKGFRKPPGAKFDWSKGRYVRASEV